MDNETTAVSALPQFKYVPLKVHEIRIIIIAPGLSTEQVQCTLVQLAWKDISNYRATTPNLCSHPPAALRSKICHRTNDIDDLDGYEALSYTWESDMSEFLQSRDIKLNGHRLQVTENLESALRHLRHENLPRAFWIDAICINQADEAEKEQQVKRMHEIYKNARQVVVWLGPATPDSKQAFEFAEMIYRCFDSTAERVDDEQWSDQPDPPRRLRIVENLLTTEHATSWVALHRLLSRRWWGRAWILQELVMAKKATVSCGDIAVPWTVIGSSILSCRDAYQAVLRLRITVETEVGSCEYDWPPEHIERAFDILARREMRLQIDCGVRDGEENLSNWLSGNRHRACTKPHDKIYSILGLLSKEFQDAIQPNYGLHIELLYQSVVKAYVQTLSRLDLICHSQHFANGQRLPSWVPDWSKTERATIFAELPICQLAEEAVFDDAVSNFSDDGQKLVVEGVCIGTVRRTHLEFTILNDLRKQRWESGICNTETAETRLQTQKDIIAPAWWYFESSAKRLFLPAIENLDPSDPQWVDCLNLFFEMVRLEWYPSESDWYERFASQDVPMISARQRFEDFEAFYSHLQGLVKSRTVIETADLQIGIALDFAEPGDIVCMLLGCHVPVVLRRMPDSSFSFLGDAYIYLLRESEIVDGIEEGMFRLENFSLS